MASYRFDVKEAVDGLRSCISYVEYRDKCTALMVKWFMLLNYEDLNDWFDSNRCCLPITLSRLLDKRIIKKETTL